MNRADKRLRHWLDSKLDPYLADLGQLVNRDCGTLYKAGVDEVIDWLENRLLSWGAEVERRPEEQYGDMLLARWRGSGRGRILLSGHADTVYPLGTAAKRPMRRAEHDANHLLGPGVTDMKSGLLSALYAVAALRAVGLDEWEEVAIVINSEEERGSPVSRYWLEQLAQEYDVGLVLEAGRANGNIVTGRKGGGTWTIMVEGKAAHAGVEPEKGANAIVQLAHYAVALDAINGTIQGGEVSNMVPPYAEMKVDTRAIDPQGIQHLKEAVQAVLRDNRERVPGTKTRVEGGIYMDAMPRTAQNLRLFALAKESAEAQNFTIGEQITGGMSDANFLAAAGLPVLDGLGPVGGLDHSPNEYLRIETIIPRTAMLAGLIHRLCQQS